jgi:exopolyphosphatase / guanosine-5'-triphosphate,3'-diphosphate pyrophosphatase
VSTDVERTRPPIPPTVITYELRGSDVAAVREQLGREPTTRFAVVARCTGGHPLVIRNDPVDANGEPFPTLFWLTCPEAVRAVSRVESHGYISLLNERVQLDEAFDAKLESAHRAYARERESLMTDPGVVGAGGGVGGTRTGVKCLHAHYAYHLAGGADPVGEDVARRIEPVHPDVKGERVAAIDQGTNSIRLLVAEAASGGGLGELARDMVITRLGEGVDATGRLDPGALKRTVEVLARYGSRARALGAGRIRVAATSAVRDASNRAEFEEAIRIHAGSELEVISGEREAGLSYLGATHGLDPRLAAPPYCVFDIGGGSTELVVGVDADASTVSTQMGSVRLTERHVRRDPPGIDEITAMEQEVDAILETAEVADVRARDAETLVAVAGTATTLRAMSLDLPRYDPEAIHRTWITLAEVEASLDRLARMTNDERAALPFMAPGRGDVIVAGAIIMAVTMRRLGFDRALVSETDILDGLAIEMLETL